MSQRTITLTGRPPVKIDDAAWPTIASARDKDFEGAHESQSFRTSRWWVIVRRHEDGRTLIYCGYDYSTAWQGERDYSVRGGRLLPAATAEQICDAISAECASIADSEHYGEDADHWPGLADQCIAAMPAEELD